MADIQAKKGILLKYRFIRTLQSTELQVRVLEAITPEKIADASFLDFGQGIQDPKGSRSWAKRRAF
jgi:hypothetical protein